MFHVTKLYPTHDATVFHAFGRVISGTCKSMSVRTLAHVHAWHTHMHTQCMLVNKSESLERTTLLKTRKTQRLDRQVRKKNGHTEMLLLFYRTKKCHYV